MDGASGLESSLAINGGRVGNPRAYVRRAADVRPHALGTGLDRLDQVPSAALYLHTYVRPNSAPISFTLAWGIICNQSLGTGSGDFVFRQPYHP